MNALDRVINYFSPVRGARRAAARKVTRAYEGASQGRRGASWRATSTSANTEAQSGLRPLRDRARDLGRNNAIAARILDVIPSHAVGTGIMAVSNTGSKKIDARVNKLWADWCKGADVTRKLSFGAMQVLAVRSMIESGEVVMRFVDREFDENGISVPPLSLQILESDYIDSDRDGIYGGSAYPDTAIANAVQRTRIGVGLGLYDAFEGLWLWKYHPGDSTVRAVEMTSSFVRGTDLVHMFKVLRPGQVRGISWFAPILTNARELADFIDAINVKARVEACFAGFITNDDSTGPLIDPDTGNSYSDPNLPGVETTTLEPGMLKELRTGQDIKFAQPTANTQIDPMLLYNLQLICAGVGCTYDQGTGDLRQANYSSLRAGKLDFWRLISQLQQLTIIPQFCQPTWDRFISRAILAGLLPKRPGGYPVNWVCPAREAIDPKKDLDAEKNEVRAGRMTMQQFIASKGNNWQDVLLDFATFWAEADKHGLVFDTDARNVDQHGRKPTVPADGAALDAQDREDDRDDGDAPRHGSGDDDDPEDGDE